MTSGYRDWTRTQDWQETAVYAVENIATAGGTIAGPFDTGRYAGLVLVGYFGALGATLTLTWSNDDVSALGIVTQTFQTFDSDPIVWTPKHLGRRCKLTLAWAAGGSNALSLYVAQTNRQYGTNPVPAGGVLVVSDTHNINAGAADVAGFTALYSGPCHAFVHTNATAWEARVESLAAAGATRPVVSLSSAVNGRDYAQFHMPRMQGQIRVTNNDGVNRNFAYGVYAAVGS